MTASLALAVFDAAAAPGRRPPLTGPPGRPRVRRHRRSFAENTWTGQQIIAASAFRAAPEQDVRPELADVEIPEGRRPVFDPDDAVTVLQGHPAHAQLRADSYATRMAVCAALARFVGEDGMAVVGHAVLAERASVYAGRPIARATAGDHVRALEDIGAVIVPFRGRSAAVAGRNLANVYVITAPEEALAPRAQAALAELAARLDVAPLLEDAAEAPTGVSLVDELRHHPFRAAFDGERSTTPARMTGHFSSSEAFPSPPSRAVNHEEPAPMTGGTSTQLPRTLLRSVTAPPPRTPARREHPEAYAARTGAERRIAVAWLIHRLGWTFHEGTEQELTIVCAPFFRAGWSALAIEHAMFHQPGGEPHPGPLPGPHTRDRARQPRIRNLWAVLTTRLGRWRDRLGAPLDPPIRTEAPARGRPRGAVTRRRQLVDQVERMGLDDPRRAVALAALRGEQVTVSWRPRGAEAAAAVAAIRQSTPDSRLRKPEMRALIKGDGTGASAGA